MSVWPVARRAMRDLRWTIVWYGLGLGAYAALTVWTYPALEESLSKIDLPDELLKFFGGEVANLARPSSYWPRGSNRSRRSYSASMQLSLRRVCSAAMKIGDRSTRYSPN